MTGSEKIKASSDTILELGKEPLGCRMSEVKARAERDKWRRDWLASEPTYHLGVEVVSDADIASEKELWRRDWLESSDDYGDENER